MKSFRDPLYKETAKRQALVFEFLGTIIPNDLIKDESVFENVMRSLFRYNDYTCFFFGSSLEKTRTMRWLAVVRVTLLTLFCDTMFFSGKLCVIVSLSLTNDLLFSLFS